MGRSKIVIRITFILVSLLSVSCSQPSNFTFFSASLPAVVTSTGFNTGPISPDLSIAITNLEAKITPSVVAVNAETILYDNSGNPVINRLAGTGWIFDESGLIVTNNHVVAGATKVSVTMNSGITYIAKTVHTDSIDDLAVIDIGVGGLPALTVGDSFAMSVGDCVIAIGNALGKDMVASKGIISKMGVTFKVDSCETLYDTLEITTPITYGNSGGPLVNMDGEVIGITSGGTLNLAGQELTGYAITSNTAKPVIRELIDNGYVKQAWFGVTVSNINDLKSQGYDHAVNSGEYVLQISVNSPAEKCGLQPGDIIVGLNGMSMDTTDDLVKMIRCCEIGQQIQITYWRDGALNTAEVLLIQNPVP